MRAAIALSLLALTAAQAPAPKPTTPTAVVEAAPAAAWQDISADDLLVIEMKDGGRVVIQLAPLFAPVHVDNIRKFARSGWWDGASVYRVQDNYVAQWGNGETEKPMPAGVVELPPAEYARPQAGLAVTPLGFEDPYAKSVGYVSGWPVALYDDGYASLTHCYGYVGVARDLAPDTGSGGELYAIIGHAPRQLDRNIAIVGRVIDGIENLSALPRGTEALGFYKEASQNVPIASVALASEAAEANRPAFQYLDTASPTFAEYVRVRANRNDDFYRLGLGGVSLCNAPVPVRKTP
jgi:peptidylprolyl isomerase